MVEDCFDDFPCEDEDFVEDELDIPARNNNCCVEQFNFDLVHKNFLNMDFLDEYEGYVEEKLMMRKILCF